MMASEVIVSAMIEEVTSSPETFGPTVSVEITFSCGSIACSAALAAARSSAET